MTQATLARRSLWHFRRTHAAVLLGVCVATATLTGALLVGDSMRASLRDLALGRIGHLVAVDVFPFLARPDLGPARPSAPALVLAAAVVNPASDALVNGATVYGLPDGSFFTDPTEQAHFETDWTGPRAVINSAVAEQLGLRVGDDLVLRVRTPQLISSELLLGRRDLGAERVRLTVHGIVSADGFGGFTLNPRQHQPACVFVPLATLQGALDQPERVNALFHSTHLGTYFPYGVLTRAELAGLGLRLRDAAGRATVVLESETLLIPPAVEDCVAVAVRDSTRGPVTPTTSAPDAPLPARSQAARPALEASPVINYLANTIEVVPPSAEPAAQPAADAPPPRSIPYSTVVAIDPAAFVLADLPSAIAGQPLTLRAGQILLNDWAADDLGAKPGDTIRLTYYVTGEFGRLTTESAEFTLAGIVALRDSGADPTFTPEYPGVTDADRMGDWDPPFPVDLKRVRDKDEEYWEQHRATPKAYVALADGLRLWTRPDAPLGRFTSFRIKDPEAAAAAPTAPRDFLEYFSVRPADVGIQSVPVREQAERAARGSTDFGGLFIGFSFFLIAAAALLVALLFRLNVERRAVEVGTLLAVGFTPREVRRLLLIEGGLVALLGALLGLAAAVGYAWLMLAGLRTWWAAAANAPFLTLAVPPGSLVFGGLLSFALALAAIAFALRGLARRPVTELLAGAVQSGRDGLASGPARLARGVALGGLLAGLGLLASALLGWLPATAGFFGGGAALLVAALAFIRVALAARPGPTLHRPGRATLLLLGLRNARRQPGRSMLTAALIGSATFVVTALAAFRLDADVDRYARPGPTGGYRLYADCTTPLLYDLNDPAGRSELGLADDAPVPVARASAGSAGATSAPAAATLGELLREATVMPFRLRDGDAASCLNLYTKTQPRILGAPPAQVARGGFRFSATLAGTDGHTPANPWERLHAAPAPAAGPDEPGVPLGAPENPIPVIADEAAVLWQLHSRLGGTIEVSAGDGRTVHLQFVALLSGSILQDELIMSEENFKQLFPAEDGYRFFLIDAPSDPAAAQLEAALEHALTDFGFAAQRTADRLRGYLAVQNTYITTFQTLGGLGLVLGALGLVAVLLRSIWERRRELALLQAVGYAPAAVQAIVLSENAALVIAGLLAGGVPALIAISPTALARPDAVPWVTLAATLLGVLLSGLGVAALAVRGALRAPLLPALRSE